LVGGVVFEVVKSTKSERVPELLGDIVSEDTDGGDLDNSSAVSEDVS
jgi:hypothetical protein